MFIDYLVYALNNNDVCRDEKNLYSNDFFDTLFDRFRHYFTSSYSFYNSADNVRSQIKGEKGDCIDFHSHPDLSVLTNYRSLGEGLDSIKVMVSYAGLIGLKGFVLTPHFDTYCLDGIVKSAECAKKKLLEKKNIDINLMYGNEIKVKLYEDEKNSLFRKIPLIDNFFNPYKHVYFVYFNVNKENAGDVQRFSRTHFKDLESSLEGMIKVQDALNEGGRVINGYITPQSMSDVRVLVIPAHINLLFTGFGVKKIVEAFENGVRPSAVETSKFPLKPSVDGIIENYGVSKVLGSDAHVKSSIGRAYTVSKRRIESSMEVFRAVCDNETYTNCYNSSNLQNLLIHRYRFIHPYWLLKLFLLKLGSN